MMRKEDLKNMIFPNQTDSKRVRRKITQKLRSELEWRNKVEEKKQDKIY